MFEKLPRRVSVYEVGLRDGLQAESKLVPTEDKLRLAQALAATGLQRIEATSFVHPKWIPALADADQLAPQLPKGPTWSARWRRASPRSRCSWRRARPTR